ncbi:DUF1254 domain-containing protein [Synechococcus sp. CCY 0621]|uniref:DUF1254 domain-containing protein n=1 Tax=Synechococcus sp. CCY 0621 TaxID=2815603 RepID=UPI001C2109D1|nr:DUF1254 domain-containing protein [Synechococcus sp. CCY 0621]
MFSIVGFAWAAAPARAQLGLAPAQVRAIAKEAYVYGYPMVDNLRVQYAYFTDQSSPEYKAPYNQLFNIPRVFTPDDRAIQTPNSDTPYSWIGLDLRTEPIVFTVPAIPKERYWSLQLIDLHTHNFAYLGTRTTGNGGGSYMVAGPSWKGETPKGITKVINSETSIASAQFRTQLFRPDDLENVKKIQSQYVVQPLSAFLGQSAPVKAPAIPFPKPLSAAEQKSSLEFFNSLNFGLQFAPVHPSETALRARFARINVGTGRKVDVNSLSPEIRGAMEQGIADAWAENEATKQQVVAGKLASGDLFGTRDYLKNNYTYRMLAAVLGIYGNSKQEAMYPAYYVDANGKPLSGDSRYTLRFAPGQEPPVDAFWSLTMYDEPNKWLVANPLSRYLLNSAMLAQFKRDSDGGLTFYVQNTSPGMDKEANWLPAPKGPFSVIMRLYIPKADALDGKWVAPALQRTGMKAGNDLAASVKVTPDTYIRAEADRTFHNISQQAGGVNRWFYIRKPTPLNQQTVVRMNRDTLYSASIVDTSKGATVTVPPLPAGRFMSVLLVDNDHYAPAVYYAPGTYDLPQDTKYLAVIVRTQVLNPKDDADIELANKLQDAVVIKANSADPLPPMQWDAASLKALTEQYEKYSAQYKSWKGMMGPRGKVDEKTRHIAAAAAWGLNPEWDATYLNYSGDHDYRVCHKATYSVPENQAFWSITVYGNDGYIKNENAVINSTNVNLNDVGTFAVYFGSKKACGEVPNRVDVSEGWNFLMRIYRPGPSVLDGRYKLPTVVPVR